jgi:ribosome-associated toxin RatA of RatAB toxin-antitoxin module
MTQIQRSALLPYSSRKLFALVNDIEAYPSFMDGCIGAQVLRRDDTVVEARLDLARGGLSQSFATRNQLHEFHTIELELLEGPFSEFRGSWQFLALDDDACKVSLDLEFSLRSGVLGAAAGKLFNAVTGNLVDAIGRRAGHLYGAAQ